MKTLTKTFGLSLIFATLMLLSITEKAQADCLKGDCATKALVSDTTEAETASSNTDEFDFDFEDPFFFNDKITFNIYNQEDELIYSKTFSKEEADSDIELKAILKKSEYLLSIHNQHYYYAKEEPIARQ